MCVCSFLGKERVCNFDHILTVPTTSKMVENPHCSSSIILPGKIDRWPFCPAQLLDLSDRPPGSGWEQNMNINLFRAMTFLARMLCVHILSFESHLNPDGGHWGRNYDPYVTWENLGSEKLGGWKGRPEPEPWAQCTGLNPLPKSKSSVLLASLLVTVANILKIFLVKRKLFI